MKFSIQKIMMVCVILTVIGSCYYDNEEELYPNMGCETSDMSYQNDILPLIDNNCYICHQQAVNLGNITLEGHTALSDYLENNLDAFLGAIKHEDNYSPMPQSAAKLADCSIEKIEAWIAQGAQNN